MDLIFPILFFLFSIFFLILSKSDNNYKKLAKNNNENFAKNIHKGLTICGYLLLICSLFWFAIIILVAE